MAKRDKRIAALRRNPHDVHPDDLNAVLSGLGFSWDQDGTSHRTYRLLGHQLSVPQKKPLKSIYVKQALKLIDTLGLLDEE